MSTFQKDWLFIFLMIAFGLAILYLWQVTHVAAAITCSPIVAPTATPTPTRAPYATPTMSPAPTSTPNTDISKPGNPTCTIPFKPAILQGWSIPNPGSMTFSWWKSTDSVDKYSITYGYSPNSLLYGEDNIPNTSSSITLNDLIPGNSVWAQIQAWKNGCEAGSNLLDP
ncbi:MAG: hypothetical protein ACRDFB_00800 [Rhabdochlamydiaceae bacterium]